MAGTVVLADFRNASVRASPDQLDRDLAGAIAATAVVIGAERAADAAARCLEPQMMEGALRQLQKPALDPLLARSLRGRRACCRRSGERAAAAAAIELPTLAEPRRVSWPTLIMIIGSLIGGWALIGVLIDVAGSFDTVIGADWLWVIIAFVLAQLAYVASAVESLGSVAGPLPLGRTVAVEVAKAFSGLAGGAAAIFATRVRYYQKQGYDTPVALSSGAIMTTASWISTAVLFGRLAAVRLGITGPRGHPSGRGRFEAGLDHPGPRRPDRPGRRPGPGRAQASQAGRREDAPQAA